MRSELRTLVTAQEACFVDSKCTPGEPATSTCYVLFNASQHVILTRIATTKTLWSSERVHAASPTARSVDLDVTGMREPTCS